MSKPFFEIQIDTNSLNSRVICDGHNLSEAIHAIQITQIAGRVPIIRLEIVPSATLRLSAEALVTLSELAETREKPDPEGSRWP